VGPRGGAGQDGGRRARRGGPASVEWRITPGRWHSEAGVALAADNEVPAVLQLGEGKRR
jgi:hypothetical protein